MPNTLKTNNWRFQVEKDSLFYMYFDEYINTLNLNLSNSLSKEEFLNNFNTLWKNIYNYKNFKVQLKTEAEQSYLNHEEYYRNIQKALKLILYNYYQDHIVSFTSTLYNDIIFDINGYINKALLVS